MASHYRTVIIFRLKNSQNTFKMNHQILSFYYNNNVYILKSNIQIAVLVMVLYNLIMCRNLIIWVFRTGMIASFTAVCIWKADFRGLFIVFFLKEMWLHQAQITYEDIGKFSGNEKVRSSSCQFITLAANSFFIACSAKIEMDILNTLLCQLVWG